MKKEIERKYLIESLDFDLSKYEKKEITQGYLSVFPVIRLRKINDKFFLTYKSKGLLSRDEFEAPLCSEEFESLWLKIEKPPVNKTRYYIPLGNGLICELDVYLDRLSGLITAEVELPDENFNFTPPDWFGKEVTYDPRYKNSAL
jgi:CYTH domain-containing protein